MPKKRVIRDPSDLDIKPLRCAECKTIIMVSPFKPNRDDTRMHIESFIVCKDGQIRCLPCCMKKAQGAKQNVIPTHACT